MVLGLLKGGNNVSLEQDYFSFELEEVLFFDKGQEVSEMLSVSLDPEISTQLLDDFVSIRGVIKLAGDYQKQERTNDIEEQPLDFHDHHSRRYLESIIEQDEGHSAFLHHFPVEISIPSYRINDMNDITVEIDSFDYELTSESQMKIKSKIHINGISQHANPDREPISADDEKDIIEDSFEFELKSEELSNKAVDHITESEVKKEKSQARNIESDKDDERVKNKHTQTFEEFFNQDNVIEKKEIEEKVDPKQLEESLEIKESAELEELLDLPDVSGGTDIVKSEQTTDEEEVVEKSEEIESTSEHVDYLAKMFSRSEEDAEVEQVQMKICIVQEEDTLESIAERYEIPKLHILKQNRLEDDELLEGQLLSIPVKTI